MATFAEELKEKLWALAERRPAEATKLMGQAFAGKKSLGEMASAPQTSDPNLKLSPAMTVWICLYHLGIFDFCVG